ncbi:hypothetical protein BDU57DRAFT_525327 [Ampelomyces quisqualis]|uniref:Uncharacterized protein n=1 Tax=Ampelomyces quisqualis TaxID=50730 RepID=A0A6A5QY25_AMPQU|nr:hypothetical protein BDU57DRAFT_525327 [Ampelomyces quisqualis]
MATSTWPVGNFRLGEHVASESSDSDQSAHSACSPQSPGAAKKSKAQKKKDRKQVGALTDDLDILLGAAFQKPNHHSVHAGAATDTAVAKTEPGCPTMEVDAPLKKLSKRTRQNMAKMEKRKLRRQDKLQRQAAGAGVQVPMLVDQQKQSSKNTAKARRERKKEERAKKVAEQYPDLRSKAAMTDQGATMTSANVEVKVEFRLGGLTFTSRSPRRLLMPSTLLYNSSPSPALPRFNTMDFVDDDNTPDNTVIAEAAQIVSRMANAVDKDKSKKDEKKRRRSEGNVKERKSGAAATGVNVTPVGPGGEEKKSDRKKNKEKGGDNAHTLEKKRKRDSEVGPEPPVGAQDDVASSKDDLVSTIERSRKTNQSTEKPSKKKVKSKRKSTDASTEKTQEQSANREVKPVADISTEEPVNKKKSKKDRNSTSLQKPDMSNADDPSVRAGNSQGRSPYVSTPKKTPVPLPPTSAFRKKLTTTSAGSPPERLVQSGRDVTEILVVETPPSCVSREMTTPFKTPVPFKLLGPADPEAGKDTRERECHGSPLTSSNLQRYTEPINDEPKPRPRGRAGSVSSASSMSIKDAFARQNKHSSNASDEACPLFPPSSQRKDSTDNTFTSALNELRSVIDFSREKQHLINHLSWRASNDAAGPLPCLSKATGCDASKERALRALKEDTSNLLSLAISNDTESLAFDRAVASSLAAETFLHHAILAHVPVPVGKLEGLYTLYCPKYAETHVDKYGFGQRTLSISRPTGFTSNVYTARLSCPPRPMTYTTLSFSVPPYASLESTVLTTSAEQYTMLLTVLGNGYILLRVDLGLFLKGKKSDMGEHAGQDVCMEFVGVKERDVKTKGAVHWAAAHELVSNPSVVKKTAHVETQNKTEKNKVDKSAVQESPKKKRGRPSNAELARRAAEKEAAQRAVS